MARIRHATEGYVDVAKNKIEKLHDFTMYNDFSDVNPSYTFDTPLDDVIKGMVNESRLVADVVNNGNYPQSSGHLIIERTSQYRVNIFYYGYNSPRMWRASWAGHHTPSFKGWVESSTLEKSEITFPFSSGYVTSPDLSASRLIKCGNIVILSLDVVSDNGFRGQRSIGTIPTGYRPSKHIITNIGFGDTWSVKDIGYCYISATTGVVTVENYAATNHTVGHITIMYYV